MASLTWVKCALWTGLCGTAWCFHDWVRLSMLSNLEQCSKFAAVPSTTVPIDPQSQPLPYHESVHSHKSFSLAVSYQAFICCSFVLSQRRGKWLGQRGCPQPFQVARCSFSAWMMQLKLTSSVWPELMTAFSEVPHLSILNIFFHFLRVPQGVSAERKKTNKQINKKWACYIHRWINEYLWGSSAPEFSGSPFFIHPINIMNYKQILLCCLNRVTCVSLLKSWL